MPMSRVTSKNMLGGGRRLALGIHTYMVLVWLAGKIDRGGAAGN